MSFWTKLFHSTEQSCLQEATLSSAANIFLAFDGIQKFKKISITEYSCSRSALINIPLSWSYFYKIHFNVILSFITVFFKQSLSISISN